MLYNEKFRVQNFEFTGRRLKEDFSMAPYYKRVKNAKH